MIRDIVKENEELSPNTKEREILKEHFASCFRIDGTFDIERFKEYLNDKVSVTSEGYELKFLGKNYARLLASLDTTTVVVPDDEHNKKAENKDSENIYISGDNLDGLKHLLKSYAHQIKCIYIDPPYNTGSDGFVYNDKFKFTVEELSEKLSIDLEHAKRILDFTMRSSASHSAWLMFMYSRLLLSRDLLSKEGAIFVSIGDNEINNLKLLMDDVFGEENFVAMCPRKTRGSATTKSYAELQKLNDYVLVYFKNKEAGKFNLKITGKKSYPFSDSRGKYYVVPLQDNGPAGTRTARPNLYYPIYQSDDRILHLERTSVSDVEFLPDRHKNDDGRWMWNKEKFSKDYLDLCISEDKVCIKHYYNASEDQNTYEQERNWLDKFLNASGTTRLNSLFTEKGLFNNPKPLDLLEYLVNLISDKFSIILDFFGGSSSTADAVMELNAKDGGNRKFIIVQLPEDLLDNLKHSDKEGQKLLKAQIDYLRLINKPLYLDELGQLRIISAAKVIKQEYPNAVIDLGFKHYTIKEVSDNTLDKLESFKSENDGLLLTNDLINEFGPSTVLATWLIHDGYGFNSGVKELDFDGYKAFWCGKHLYLINKNISKEALIKIVEKYELDGSFNPENVVLFGYSFLWNEIDELKINLSRLKNTEKSLRINFDVRF